MKLATTAYKLDIKYNDSTFCVVSDKRSGLHAVLQTSTENFLYLGITTLDEEDKFKHYWLKQVRPGDHLKFTYGIADQTTIHNIEDIESVYIPDLTFSISPGMKMGLDVTLEQNSDPIRLSHPLGGGFMFMLGNVPLNHARTFIMAGNEKEEWDWQLADLYPGNSISLKVVETDWNTPFPRITEKSENNSALNAK